MARTARSRDYAWIGASAGFASIAEVNAMSSIIVFNAAGTLVRVRGNLLCSIDGPADNDKKVVGAGLMIVSDQQVSTGATAISSPIDDMDADWLWH